MKLPDMGDVTKDAVKVLLVLVNPARISNSRSINEVDHPVFKNKVVGCRLLSCRLAGSKVLVFIWPPNVDVLALPGVCGEAKLRWNGSNDLLIGSGRRQIPKVEVVGKSVDPGGLAHTSLPQHQNIQHWGLTGVRSTDTEVLENWKSFISTFNQSHLEELGSSVCSNFLQGS